MSLIDYLSRMYFANSKKSIFFLIIMILSGCATYHYEAMPLENKEMARKFLDRSLDDTGLKDYFQKYHYPVSQWPIKNWDIDALTLAAYYFHPELQIAIKQYDKANVHAEFINQIINPGISVPPEYHSDTGGGKSPWSIGILFDFVFERSAKREARYEQAQAESNAARIHINLVAWNIYSEMRRQYFNYHAVLKDQELLSKQKDYAEQNMQLLNRRKELGQASEFEVSSMQLELQRIRLALTSHKVTVVEAWHALADSLGLPASALDDIEFPDELKKYFDTLNDLNQSQLQGIALTQRMDIQQALAEYSAQEAKTRLEIEKQFPDITLSPGFLFDQGDNIWQLGAAWILPLFHTENEGAIKEALADREIKQAEFLALQSRIINEVSSAWDSLKAQMEALKEAEQLLQEAQDRNRQINRQYKLGYADHLQLSRSLLEMVTVEQAVSGLRYSVIKSAGQLEDTLQYPVFFKKAYQYLYDVQVN